MYQNITQLFRGIALNRMLLVLVFAFAGISMQAQTVSTSSGTNYNGDYSINNASPLLISFVVENNAATAKTLTSVSTQMAPYFTATAGAASVVKLYASSTSLSGVFDVSTAAWTLVYTGNTTVPSALAVVPVVTNGSFVLPANSKYRFALELSKGLAFSFTPTPTPNTFTSGSINLRVGTFTIGAGVVGYAGVTPAVPAGNAGAFFGGSVTLADCTPTNATAPVIAASPSSICNGTSATLNIVGGSLNGASNWVWRTGSCTGTIVGTGSSITVSPTSTTTYYVSGEGGCAPASGPCATKTLTVSNCSCVAPDSATICAGTVQKLSLVVPASAIQTFSSATPIAIPSVGNATPYPAAITVSGVPAGARVKSVTINGITHTFPADIDIALVSPLNTPVILMSDVAGTGSITGINYTFDDAAPTAIGTVTTPSGTYRPSNSGTPDNFPAPGPGSLTQATPTLASFGTGNQNGTWNLYVVDDAAGDLGTISSWSITFEATPVATWTGTAGTIFTDAAATVPYVAGTPTNTVYVKPSSSTTYVANITAGPCAGNNNIPITVLSVPTVTVTASSTCGPSTLTASGASSYTWSPATGLSSTSGSTVVATPGNTTTYTVTGVNGATCSSTASVTVNGTPTASVITALAPSPTYQIQEGFATFPPAGWARTNNSSPGGNQWFQGDPAAFAAFNGATNSYAAADYSSTTTTGVGDISNWLFSPVVSLKNGDQISFYTRTYDPTYPDRLELRFSTNGASTNVGATTTSVGDYSNLVLSVNPTLAVGGYPGTWTKYTGVISGVTGTVSGRFAFRYFVTGGGGLGDNSVYLGVDQVEYYTPAAALCPNTVSNIAVNITGGTAPYTVVYSNGTTNTTINNYVSGSNIQVSPAATTTYTIVSVTGANGCAGVGNSGSAVVTVTQPPAITVQPAATTTCIGSNASISVTATPVGNTFQWQISTDGGATYTNLTNNATYGGTTTPTLTITGATAAMNSYRYRVITGNPCGASVTSTGAVLTVNAPAVITTQPVAASVCAAGSLTGRTTTFTVGATGNSLAYVWQTHTASSSTWTTVSNSAIYSGATTNTLTVTNPPITLNGSYYRALVNSGGCAALASDSAKLTVNPIPTVTVANSGLSNIYPGLSTTLNATATPAGSTIVWNLNGVAIPGSTGSSYTVNVDGLGVYTATATTTNGCSATSSNSVTIGDSVNTVLFIYPSPTSGQFQVRYYSGTGNTQLPRALNIYDSKGSRVYSRVYTINAPYSGMDVDMTTFPSGIYTVELSDRNGNRIKTGRVVIR